MTKLSNILFLLLALFCLNCFSQSENATLFFKDGDSLQGYAFINNNKIKFRVSLDSKGDFWSFEMVNKVEFETFFGIKTYEYVKINEFNDPLLLELVTKGEVSLYRETSSSWILDSNFPENNFPNNRKVTTATNFLIRKNDDYASCLNCGIINKWRKRTMDFLIDCPTLVEKIKSYEYGEADLQEIVEYYNDFCTEL